MNVDAISVYVSTCRLALQTTSIQVEDEPSNETEQNPSGANNTVNNNNNNNSHSWTELYHLLPCLRQSLTCTLCGQIAADPIATAALTLSCRQCVVPGTTVGDVQGKILVQCYRKLCQYLVTTNFYRKLGSLNANGGTRSLAELIREGASLAVDCSKDPNRQTGSLLSRLLAQPPLPGRSLGAGFNSNSTSPGALVASNGLQLTASNLYSVSQTSMHSTRITIKREQGSPFPPDRDEGGASSSSSSTTSTSSSSGSELLSVLAAAGKASQVRTPKRKVSVGRPRSKFPGKGKLGKKNTAAVDKAKVCWCGYASRHPGKMTCCGQRCPCYAEGLACAKCKCRGCKNPLKQSMLKSASSSSSLSSTSSSSTSDVPLHPTRQKASKSKGNPKSCNNDGEVG